MGAVEKNAAYSAGSCNCCAFILLLFAITSPSFIWASYWTSFNTYTTINTGVWVGGSIWQTTQVSYWSAYRMTTRWTYWSEIPAQTPCQNTTYPLYTRWAAPYDLCVEDTSKPSGLVYQQPSQVLTSQVLGVLATIFAAFATSTAFAASDKMEVGYSSAVCTLIACACSIALWAVWVGWDYASDFRNSNIGGTIPVWAENIKGEQFLLPTWPPVTFWWGPGFTCAVTASIILLFQTVTLFTVAKNTQDDYSFDDYGGGV